MSTTPPFCQTVQGFNTPADVDNIIIKQAASVHNVNDNTL